MSRGFRTLTGSGTRFTLRVPAGSVTVRMVDALASGRWRFHAAAPSPLSVDYLAPGLCTVLDAELIERDVPDNFIPTPRLRLEVNGRIYDVVTTDPGVLARHYGRPRHQEIMYHRPDPWTTGFHQARVAHALQPATLERRVPCSPE